MAAVLGIPRHQPFTTGAIHGISLAAKINGFSSTLPALYIFRVPLTIGAGTDHEQQENIFFTKH
jgi:hypothetical protein